MIKPTGADAIPASADAAAMRRVRFFDNTGAAVHRHDLLPFLEYAPRCPTKKSAGFRGRETRARELGGGDERGHESAGEHDQVAAGDGGEAAVGLIPDASRRRMWPLHVDLADAGEANAVKSTSRVMAELEAARVVEASLKAARL